MRCSGARVFLTPSDVKESLTAAIVVRSLWAAERSSWAVGVVVGWDVDRLVACWPVSVDVVVAVDIGCAKSPWVWLVEGPAAHACGGMDWKIPLAGDGFEGLRRAISHRGDRGAV